MESQTQQDKNDKTQIEDQMDLSIPTTDAAIVARRRTNQRPPKVGMQVRVRKVEDCIDALTEQMSGVRTELAQLNARICYLTSKLVHSEEEPHSDCKGSVGMELFQQPGQPAQEVAKADLLGENFLTDAVRAVNPKLQGPFEELLEEDDYLPLEERVVGVQDTQIVAMYKAYFAKSALRFLPFVPNRFPLVLPDGSVSMGMTIRSQAPLIFDGKYIKYVRVVIGKSTYKFGCVNFVQIPQFVTVMSALVSTVYNVPTDSFYTLIAEELFDDFSWVLAMNCCMKGIVANGLCTGAILNVTPYTPAQLDKKFTFAKQRNQTLFIAGVADELPEEWENNSLMVMDGEFVFENRMLNPIPVLSTTPIGMVSLMDYRGGGFNFELESESIGQMVPKPKLDANKGVKQLSSKVKTVADIKEELKEWERLVELAEVFPTIPLSKDIMKTVKVMKAAVDTPKTNKITDEQFVRIVAKRPNMTKAMKEYRKAQKKPVKEKKAVVTESQYLTEEQNRTLSGAERQRYIARAKKKGGPVDAPLNSVFEQGKGKAKTSVQQQPQNKYAKFAPKGKLLKMSKVVREEELEPPEGAYDGDDGLNV